MPAGGPGQLIVGQGAAAAWDATVKHSSITITVRPPGQSSSPAAPPRTRGSHSLTASSVA